MGDGGCAIGVGCGGGRGDGVCCLKEVHEGCSCQVNILQCTLEGVEVVGDKCMRWKSVPLCYCSAERSCICSSCGGGYLSVFGWVVVSCVAVYDI